MGNTRLRRVVGKVEKFVEEIEKGEAEALEQIAKSEARIKAAILRFEKIVQWLKVRLAAKQLKHADEKASIHKDVEAARKLLAKLRD